MGVVHNTNDEVRAPIIWGNAMLADSLALFFATNKHIDKKKKGIYIARNIRAAHSRTLENRGNASI